MNLDEMGQEMNEQDFDGVEIVDEVEEIAPGTGAGLSVELQPGTYAVICNVAGHYEQGMFTTFTAE